MERHLILLRHAAHCCPGSPEENGKVHLRQHATDLIVQLSTGHPEHGRGQSSTRGARRRCSVLLLKGAQQIYYTEYTRSLGFNTRNRSLFWTEYENGRWWVHTFQLNEATGPLEWQPPCCGGLILCRVYPWHPNQEASINMKLIHNIHIKSLSRRAMEAVMGSIQAFGSSSHEHQHAVLLCSASCLWRVSEAFRLDPFHPFSSTTPTLLLNDALSPNCGYITNAVTKWQPFSHFVN